MDLPLNPSPAGRRCAAKVGQASRLPLAGTRVFYETKREVNSDARANQLEDFKVLFFFTLALRARPGRRDTCPTFEKAEG